MVSHWEILAGDPSGVELTEDGFRMMSSAPEGLYRLAYNREGTITVLPQEKGGYKFALYRKIESDDPQPSNYFFYGNLAINEDEPEDGHFLVDRFCFLNYTSQEGIYAWHLYVSGSGTMPVVDLPIAGNGNETAGTPQLILNGEPYVARAGDIQAIEMGVTYEGASLVIWVIRDNVKYKVIDTISLWSTRINALNDELESLDPESPDYEERRDYRLTELSECEYTRNNLNTPINFTRLIGGVVVIGDDW